tara:strand:+ start:7509 stop:8249 length:741 start_codon:yes stop_codon:yes gene_type:complete
MNIVLTGAYGGIGKCVTLNLIKDNNLYLGSRDVNKINALIDECRIEVKNNNFVDGSYVDASNSESIKDFLEKANESLGSIDCIINCVGSLFLKPAHMTKEDDLEDVYKTNVFSCFYLLKHGVKFLKKNGGSLLFFSSAASKVGLRNHEAISSAKAAISGLVLSAASTYSSYNIRINALAPGLVDTPMTSNIVKNETSLKYSENLHGLKRIGKPKNLVPIIRSLIDKNSNWITGQTIFVDGGLSNVK